MTDLALIFKKWENHLPYYTLIEADDVKKLFKK